MKFQYTSTEALRLSFPPFFHTSGVFIVAGADNVTFTIKAPDTTTQVVVPAFDTDVKFWKAEVAIGSFQEGIWLIKAESDVAGTIPQFRALSWGDYVDDIGEARQAALGRWKIVGTQLIIYEDDGTTPFKTFNLLDTGGLPSVSSVFERTPV